MHPEAMTFFFFFFLLATCKLGFLFNGYLIVVSNGLHKTYLLLTNSSFTLLLSESHRGCLIWVKFVELTPKQKFESQLNVSQSGRAK